jgi:hypothetical protein
MVIPLSIKFTGSKNSIPSDGTVDPEILLDGTDVSGLSKYERHWELANQWEIYDDSEELEQ